MIAILAFPIIAAALVLLAGRRDAARDPRLTITLLFLTAAFPVMAATLPKIALFPASPAGEDLPLGNILAGVWLVGFTWAMARLGFALLTLHGWRKRSHEVAKVNGIPIRMLAELHGPVAAGVLEPLVFVPTSWHNWSSDYQRVVLEHELAHHRRRDPLWRLVAELTCAIHWFNPPVRWMTQRLILQCEYACDAIVLGKGIDAKSYASVLCDFAGQHSPSRLAPAMAEACPLETRVRRMLAPARTIKGKTLALFALLGALTACSLAMIGRETPQTTVLPTAEIDLRWSANPFPAEP